jgi:thiamine-phosphate pyrophosphorylase
MRKHDDIARYPSTIRGQDLKRSAQLTGRGLYAITEGPRPDLLEVVAQVLAGGARLLQYRDKSSDTTRRHAEAAAIRQLCRAHAVPLIINDDITLAHAVGADGVHLGKNDGDIVAARAVLGDDAIIGVSCYDSLARAQAAAGAGASYIAFGAFFTSPTKPMAPHAPIDLLRQSAALGVPRVAIGGITPDNAAALVEAGTEYLAVISAVFGAADVCAAARRFSRLYPSD